MRVLEEPRCRKLLKRGSLYIVNDEVGCFIKYSSKGRSPWPFALSPEDLIELHSGNSNPPTVVVGLVCGGDGVCALSKSNVYQLVGENGGWISVRRGFGGSYGVTGSLAKLKGKIPLKRWPLLVFGPTEGDIKNGSNN